MIFYFSATGNSKYVAERIARECNDRIAPLWDHTPNISLEEHEMLGIVTPVNWWELPILTRDFLSNLTVEGNGEHYTFLVVTYGSTPGTCGEDGRRVLKRQNITLDAAYGVRMPDNWTPVFDLSNPEKVKDRNRQAEEEITGILQDIQARKQGNHTKGRVPYFFRFFTDQILNKDRKTKNFYVEDTCIGCGLCAEKCPVQAIEIREKKPVWVKEKCAICFGCLHRCPKFAIQYGNGKTKLHGQYRNPNTSI